MCYWKILTDDNMLTEPFENNTFCIGMGRFIRRIESMVYLRGGFNSFKSIQILVFFSCVCVGTVIRAVRWCAPLSIRANLLCEFTGKFVTKTQIIYSLRPISVTIVFPFRRLWSAQWQRIRVRESLKGTAKRMSWVCICENFRQCRVMSWSSHRRESIGSTWVW